MLLPVEICLHISAQIGCSIGYSVGLPGRFFTVISDAKFSVTCGLLKNKGTHTGAVLSPKVRQLHLHTPSCYHLDLNLVSLNRTRSLPVLPFHQLAPIINAKPISNPITHSLESRLQIIPIQSPWSHPGEHNRARWGRRCSRFNGDTWPNNRWNKRYL